jgi:hypothetical protein
MILCLILKILKRSNGAKRRSNLVNPVNPVNPDSDNIRVKFSVRFFLRFQTQIEG